MSSSRETLVAVALCLAAGGGLAQVTSSAAYPGIGRAATPKELAAWDIDVRPDFKGLPPGAGSVAMGMAVWEGKCASCHGIFGESNEVSSPLAGGTTKDDVKTGRAARLTDAAFPGRTTLMKVATVSTLWDYIHRAMPWKSPKSLKPDEVYAVTAFLLNLGGVLPDDFTLSELNIAEVQKLLPNRNGMTTDHGLWPGRSIGNGGKADVSAVACMKDCSGEPKLVSLPPDVARNAPGKLADQNRMVSVQHDTDATRSQAAAHASASIVPISSRCSSASNPMGALNFAQSDNCESSGAVDKQPVSRAPQDVASTGGRRPDAARHSTVTILSDSSGSFGTVTLPAAGLPQTNAEVSSQQSLAEARKR